jgi:predicted DNA-binding transcriptional regulator AlpA
MQRLVVSRLLTRIARTPNARQSQDCTDRLVDGEEAGNIIGVKSRSRRYALIAKGPFPQPVKVGTSTRFSEREGQFMAERIAERDQARPSSREWRGRIMGVRLRCCARLSL